MRSELRILNSREKKPIYVMLYNQFGFDEKLDYVMLISIKNKIYLMSKDFSREMIDDLKDINIGVYFGELKDTEIRLSLEGSQLIGPKCSKNIFVIDDELVKKWIIGEDIEYDCEINSFVILKNNLGDFIGCGKAKDGKILNFIPKNRRVNIIEYEED